MIVDAENDIKIGKEEKEGQEVINKHSEKEVSVNGEEVVRGLVFNSTEENNDKNKEAGKTTEIPDPNPEKDKDIDKGVLIIEASPIHKPIAEGAEKENDINKEEIGLNFLETENRRDRVEGKEEKEQNLEDLKGDEVINEEKLSNEERIEEEERKEEEVYRQWLSEKNKLTRKDNCLFLIFTILYIVIIMLQFQMVDRYKVHSSIKRKFGLPDAEFQVVDKGDPLDMTQRMMDMAQEYFWIMDNKYETAGFLRFTRRLYRTLGKNSSEIIINHNRDSLTPIINPSSYWNNETERTEPYEDEDTTNEINYVFTFNPEESYKGLGGFVQKFTKLDLFDQNDYNELNQTAIEITTDKLLYYFENDKTCVYIIDLILLNYELGYVIPIVLTYLISNDGLTTLTHRITILNKGIYEGTAGAVRGIMEGIFLFIIIYYFISLIHNVRIKVNYKYSKNEKRLYKLTQKSLVKYGECYLDVNLTKDQMEKYVYKKIPSKWNLLLKVLARDKIMLVQFLNIIMSFCCFVLWGIFAGNLLSHLDLINKLFDEFTFRFPINAQEDLLTAAEAFENYKDLLTINFLVLFVKIISLLSTYVRTTKVFLNTLSEAMSDLLSFFIFFITLLLGLSIFTYIYYGQFIPEFMNLLSCLQMNLAVCLGLINLEIFQYMVETHELLSHVYFFITLVLFRFIVIKMMRAIILYYFNFALEKHEKGKSLESGLTYCKYDIGYSYLTSVIFNFKKLVGILFNFIFGCSCGKKEKKIIVPVKTAYMSKSFTAMSKPKTKPTKQGAKSSVKLLGQKNAELKIVKLEENSNKEKKEKDELRVVHTKDRHLFNLDLEEEFDYYTSNPYFEAEKDNFILKEVYETKYRRIFVEAVYFILFLGVLIALVIINTAAPWHKLLQEMILAKLTNQGQKPLESLRNIDLIRSFVLNDGIPQIFHKHEPDLASYNGTEYDESLAHDDYYNYYLLNYNTVLKNRILLTVKNSQVREGYEFFEDTRAPGELSLYSKMKHENTTAFVVNDTLVAYKKYSSYRELGGYTLELDLNYLDPTNQLSKDGTYYENVFSELITPYTNFVIVEFITDNFEYDIITYSGIIFKADYGAFKKIELKTYIIKYRFFQSYLDAIDVIMQIFFAILLIRRWFRFIVDFRKHYKTYERWYQEIVLKMNIKTLELRWHHKPEILRKWLYLFNFGRVSELAIIALCSFLIFQRFSMYSVVSPIGGWIDTREIVQMPIFEVRSTIYEYMDQLDSFQVVGTLAIFISSIKLFGMLNLGKYFSLLIRTFEDSKVNNFTFMVILVCLLPAFVFYSHLSFGEQSLFYSSLDQAIVSCFRILFGEINFQEYTDASSVFGPIFFFLYLFTINMILLNLFVAVIYSSYIKVRDEIKKSREKWSGRRVFFFCCYRKKLYLVADKQDTVEDEFSHSNASKIYDSYLNLLQRTTPEEWAENEVLEISQISKTLFNNNLVLSKMKSALLGEVYEEKYRNVTQNHVDTYSFLYLKNMLNFIDNFEEDILTIENSHKYLKVFDGVISVPNKIQKLIKKNDINLSRTAALEKQVIELEADLKKLRKLNEGFDDLRKFMGEED